MLFKSFAFDAPKKFTPPQTAEANFARALRKVARIVGHIIDSHTTGAVIHDNEAMMKALVEYSKTLEPWARRQSAKLLQKVSQSNKRAFTNNSKKMAMALKDNVLADENVGHVALTLMQEQVTLIKSIPIEAGQRAQRIAIDNILKGKRAKPDADIVAELLRQRREDVTISGFGLSGDPVYKEEMERSTQVAVNRATLIARTETARANAAFTEARSVAVGAIGYIWRTTMDGAERKSHAKMNKKYIAYSHPPTLSDGTVGHAGTFPNCRCWQEPVFEDQIQTIVFLVNPNNLALITQEFLCQLWTN